MPWPQCGRLAGAAAGVAEVGGPPEGGGWVGGGCVRRGRGGCPPAAVRDPAWPPQLCGGCLCGANGGGGGWSGGVSVWGSMTRGQHPQRRGGVVGERAGDGRKNGPPSPACSILPRPSGTAEKGGSGRWPLTPGHPDLQRKQERCSARGQLGLAGSSLAPVPSTRGTSRPRGVSGFVPVGNSSPIGSRYLLEPYLIQMDLCRLCLKTCTVRMP